MVDVIKTFERLIVGQEVGTTFINVNLELSYNLEGGLIKWEVKNMNGDRNFIFQGDVDNKGERLAVIGELFKDIERIVRERKEFSRESNKLKFSPELMQKLAEGATNVKKN